MKVMLELVRILFLFLFFGGMLGGLINLIYKVLGVVINEDGSGGWFPAFAILLILYVLYKNWLQFSSFVKGTKNKLSAKVSLTLISSALMLIIIAPFI
ncbi:hypothetical protein FZC79_00650 [Rossellomorea vietnamensis]|uniref:Uncharacterized protein n=2 Tax=Rossellomorea TaxID=2837508 RepID=A0A5D4KKV6_9BACI|nr:MULTISPECIES: hypothetical protein [Rossellomorea]TYR77365.1 hypothetical protein FZC79_00650 [Rossellomorea vietnamensis]TYS78196.1 hypothetical protein FZC80_13275 [Rossellomorea aquimaris]